MISLIHQMPGSKGLRPTSPVHVHVDDDVPVHVHVKQPKKKKGGVVSYQCSSVIVTCNDVSMQLYES
jgi:hypothetical protein